MAKNYIDGDTYIGYSGMTLYDLYNQILKYNRIIAHHEKVIQTKGWYRIAMLGYDINIANSIILMLGGQWNYALSIAKTLIINHNMLSANVDVIGRNNGSFGFNKLRLVRIDDTSGGTTKRRYYMDLYYPSDTYNNNSYTIINGCISDGYSPVYYNFDYVGNNDIEGQVAFNI